MNNESPDCFATCPLALRDMQVVDPIDGRATDGVDVARRTFISKSLLAAAAAALAACAGADSVTAPNVSGLTIRVGDYSALSSVGGIALVNASGVSLAIVRTADATFVALSRVCPHEGATVGTNSSGGFTCPQHGARFSSTGTWLGGQRTSNMRAYSTNYDAVSGILTIG